MSRPKGSNNRAYHFVAVDLARCPHCQSTDLVVEPGYPPHETDATIRRIKRCRDCGNRSVILERKTQRENNNYTP
jgi:DNA-directed RNA polymerase subunit RPC12/RpoP